MMSAGYLDHEYQAVVSRTTPADLAPLRAAGVGAPGLAIGPAVATIKVNADGLWEPDPDSDTTAFILPVRVENALSPEATDRAKAVCEGTIVDSLAFST